MYYDQPITNQSTRNGTFDDLEVDEPFPGVVRRTLDSDRATVTSYSFAPAARFPLHRHLQEQITLVQSGSVEMTAGDQVHPMSTGDWLVIPPDVDHGVTAGSEGAALLAVIVPRREHADAFTLADGEPHGS